jgi:hypothetical protein
VDNSFTQFFSQHVILTIAIIAFVIWMFMGRGGGGILGSWIVRFLVIVMLTIWIWIALMSFLDRARREVSAQVDHATQSAENAIPQWMKDLWAEVKDKIPSPGDMAVDKVCDYAGVALACEIYKKEKEFLEHVTQDMKSTEEICNASPAVETKWGVDGKVKFCAGNTFQNAQRVIKAVAGGAVVGSLSSISSLLVPDIPSLDQNPYLGCLYNAVRQTPNVNARSCSATDPHLWRLCVEFHMQLALQQQLDDPPPPLDPKILACRKQALGLP